MFTKKDLKEFDIVKLRNGEVFIILNIPMAKEGLGIFNKKHYWCYKYLDGYSSHLSDREDPNDDIVAVKRRANRLLASAWVTLENFFDGMVDYNWTWTRPEEPVEMTLEEVCKALGKEIKIVKK